MRLFLILLFLFPSVLQANDVIRMLNDPIPPYVEGEMGEPVSGGIAYRLHQEIFRRLGLAAKVQFKLVPWARALDEVKLGKSDGLMTVHKTKEREKYFEYSHPLFSTPLVVFFSKKRHPDGVPWQDVKDLGKYAIAVTRGASYGDTWDQAVNAYFTNVNQVPSAVYAMNMVYKNRVDITPMNLLSGLYFIQRDGMKTEVGVNEKPLHLNNYHMVFSKKSPYKQLIPRINSIIANLNHEGFIENLLKEYKILLKNF